MNMKRVVLLCFYAALAGSVSTMAAAQAPASKSMDMKSTDKMERMDGNKASSSHSATGVVKSMDSKRGSLMLAHDPIESLNWPSMTMAFKVQDKNLLDKVKVGDKIQFKFAQSGKEYTITEIK